ncbi:unnamed protein product, partial [Choristocarpus tenellus]
EHGRVVQRFFGWGAKRDEWLPSWSHRVQPLNSRASWRNSWTEEAPVDDSGDPELSVDGEVVYAVVRQGDAGSGQNGFNGGICLVDNINTFGRAGGFEALVACINPPQVDPRSLQVMPTSDPSSPKLLDEMAGVGEGAETMVRALASEEESATAVNARGEVMAMPESVTHTGTGEALREPKKTIPARALKDAVGAVASIRPLLSRGVASSIIQGLATASIAALKGFPDTELRGLSRDRLEGILSALRELLKRGSRRGLVAVTMERLQLDLALKFYKCPYMERKLNGLKVLTDAVSAVTQGNGAGLTRQGLVEWLDENNFIRMLFSGHTQLIQRSGEILSFLCRQQALSPAHLDIIWEAGGGGLDKDRRMCVHEVLRSLLYQLGVDLVGRLVDKLFHQAPSEVLEDTVVFIKDIAKATHQQGVGPALRLLDLLWSMVQDDSPYTERIARKAEEALLEVYGFYNLANHRPSALQQCVKHLTQGRAVVISLKLMESVLDQFTLTSTTVYDRMSKREAVRDLEEEHRLTHLLLRCSNAEEVEGRRTKYAMYFLIGICCLLLDSDPLSPHPHTPAPFACMSSITLIGEHGGRDRDWDKSVVCGRDSHLVQVKARLQMLEYLYNNSALVLESWQADMLWACLGPGRRTNAGDGGTEDSLRNSSSSATPGELSILLSWLSKACEAWGEGDGAGGGVF